MIVDELKKFVAGIYYEALDWCRGRNWFIRSLLLLWFLYLLIKSLINPEYRSVLGALNLGIHELGHLVFSFFGNFLQILGGTLLECLAPILGMINFYRQKDFFAISLCFGWLSTAFFGVATYIADARTMSLPLVTPFGSDSGVYHDWNYLLSKLGMLQHDSFLAFILRLLATVSMLVCLITGSWLLLHMKDNKTLYLK